MKAIHIIMLTCVCILTSCQKDKQDDICYDLPSSPSVTGWNYTHPITNVKAPYFNPNNKDEIIYRLESYTESGGFISSHLWKINLIAKENELLIDDVRYNPKWGISDWLLFNRRDNQVWKMKSNGDNPTQLTFGETHISPDWNPDNDIFVCKTFSNLTLTISDEGNILDTLTNVFYYRGKWSPDEKYIAATTYSGGVDVNNLETGEVIRFQSEFDIFKGNGRGMSWTPDGKYLIWTASEGVFKSDMETFSTIMIKKSCESLGYFSPSVSADYEIIFERRTNSVDEDKNEYYSESQFVITDINGENEREVVLE